MGFFNKNNLEKKQYKLYIEDCNPFYHSFRNLTKAASIKRTNQPKIVGNSVKCGFKIVKDNVFSKSMIITRTEITIHHIYSL